MKRKKDFIVRQIADQNIVVAVGQASKSFHAMIKLNGTGLFIWNRLSEDTTEEEIVDAVLEMYEVSREQAAADVRSFIRILTDAGAIE